MRTLLTVVFVLALSVTVYAYCTNNTIVTPEGRIIICQTCCDHYGSNCQTLCF